MFVDTDRSNTHSNPSGEKYSELGHDTTTAVGSAAQPALPGSNPSNSAALPISNTLETDHEAEKKNQGGELRQILFVPLSDSTLVTES